MLQMRSIFGLRTVVSAVLAGVLWAPAVQAETLRVCVDPDRMPFSQKTAGSDPGVYVELAKLVGKELKMDVEFHWWLTVNPRRAMRYTIKQKKCDIVFAIPADHAWEMGALKRTKAFLNLTYALVGKKSLNFTKMDDLKGLRLGAQYQTPPHLSLAVQGKYDVVTRQRVHELFAALENDEIDAFFAWGPVAGYQNKFKHDDRWKLTPIKGDTFEGKVAVAVHQDKKDLVGRLDGAFANLKPQIQKLAEKYGLPVGPAVDFDHLSIRKRSAATDPNPTRKSEATPLVQVAKVSDKTTGNTPEKMSDVSNGHIVVANTSTGPGPDPKDPVAKAGRIKFNDICSHCHSADGASPEKRRDLRLLKKRYNEEFLQTAEQIMKEGLPDYGMPSWDGILSDQDFVEILAFLKTIQH